jgi:GTPase
VVGSPKVGGSKGAAAAGNEFDIFDGQGQVEGMAEMTLEDSAADAADAKPNVRVVVCGHVDSGKSTLNGHLVYQLGKITDQEMRRATKSAAAVRASRVFIL